MDTRRIAALALIERIRRHEIEAETAELGRLRDEAARLDRRRAELEQEMESGAQSSDPALLTYLGNFLRSVRIEIERVESDRAGIEPDLSALEDRIAAAFREMKTLENVRRAALLEARHEAQRREDNEAAEMALLQWWRNRQEDRHYRR